MVKAMMRPFVKWAGGKGRYLGDIHQRYPRELGSTITKYAEPFVGGGAVLFDILNHYSLEKVYISDVNDELIISYTTIRDHCDELIEMLKILNSIYTPSPLDVRKDIYYKKRATYNNIKISGCQDKVELAALFIFLNRTCYNGLYRVNSQGSFNVPIGYYKNPRICDEDNLRTISDNLHNVKIVCGNYRESLSFIDNNTFVYFDPPYRPLNTTSYFTAYDKTVFKDEEQILLSTYFRDLDKMNAKILMSNSDPKNQNLDDMFFEKLYSGFQIDHFDARRMINCNSNGRGKIRELLISNY